MTARRLGWDDFAPADLFDHLHPQEPDMDDEYLTEQQLAAEANISVRTLQKWRVDGNGPPYVKLVGAVRYRRTDFAAWVAKRTITATEK